MGCGARARGVGEDGAAHGGGDARDLAADAAVAEDADALADEVAEAAEGGVVRGGFAPGVLLLPVVEEVVGVGVDEGGHCYPGGEVRRGLVEREVGGEVPFCDLGAMDA